MSIDNATQTEIIAAQNAYYKRIADGLKKDSLAISKQVGGDHYKSLAIQPAEFCYKNNIPYLEATAIKYLCRWRNKGGVQDLDKAIHFIEMLKEFENANNN